MTIYDGASADEKTLGIFCGSKLPHPVDASQNQMYVVFKSDASVQRKGFLATHSTGKLLVNFDHIMSYESFHPNRSNYFLMVV